MAGLKPPKLPKQTPKPFSEEDIARMLILCSGETFLDKRNTALVLAFCGTAIEACTGPLPIQILKEIINTEGNS